MYSVFVIGNIASGKSAACRYLASKGGLYIDLDELAKSLYVPGSDLVCSIANAFGWDVLTSEGGIDRARLAAKAFSSPEDTKRLNDLVHPVLVDQLAARLLEPICCTVSPLHNPFAVVEVSAPRDFKDGFGLADEVIAVSAPVDVRRARAVKRGMSEADFNRRADIQPSEEELRSLATLFIDNSVDDDRLFQTLDAWLVERGFLSSDRRG